MLVSTGSYSTYCPAASMDESTRTPRLSVFLADADFDVESLSPDSSGFSGRGFMNLDAESAFPCLSTSRCCLRACGRFCSDLDEWWSLLEEEDLTGVSGT